MANLPPLPKIKGDIDLLLDVYTHSSLRFDGAPMNDDYGSTDRLVELGEKVLELVVTNHFYLEKPFLDSEQLQIKRAEALSDVNIDQWMDAYGLKGKLRFAPGNPELINNHKEMRKFFNTYVGALYIRNGIETIQGWISRLINPNSETQYQVAPLQKIINSGYQSPPPPLTQPPPLPAFPPSPSTPYGAVSSLVSLALVNQTAAQKGYQVTYPAEQTGPPHQPTWTVKCCLNSQECGRGVGKSQKIAKEEAARQAWVTMGWGPHA